MPRSTANNMKDTCAKWIFPVTEWIKAPMTLDQITKRSYRQGEPYLVRLEGSTSCLREGLLGYGTPTSMYWATWTQITALRELWRTKSNLHKSYDNCNNRGPDDIVSIYRWHSLVHQIHDVISCAHKSSCAKATTICENWKATLIRCAMGAASSSVYEWPHGWSTEKGGRVAHFQRKKSARSKNNSKQKKYTNLRYRGKAWVRKEFENLQSYFGRNCPKRIGRPGAQLRRSLRWRSA